MFLSGEATLLLEEGRDGHLTRRFRVFAEGERDAATAQSGLWVLRAETRAQRLSVPPVDAANVRVAEATACLASRSPRDRRGSPDDRA